MKKNTFFVLAVILLSFLGYLITNTLNISLGYWQREGIIALISGFLLYKLLSGSKNKKILLSIGGVIVGFLITFIFSSWVHDIAMWEICLPAINEKYNLDPGRDNGDKDPLSKDGTYRSWYQHLECEDHIMPFPWGKEAKFSDNPPGFIPDDSSKSGNLN